MSMRAPFAMLAVVVVWSTPVQAVDNIRYVSTTGNNANTCTLSAPCRSLQRGINVTPANGELRILDSGDYGLNAAIARSVTITGNGHTVILGNPITINQANATVVLRGLTLDGQRTVANGINIVNAATVHVEQSVIYHFTGQGISATAAGVEVFVIDSILRDNIGAGLVMFEETSRLTIDNSRFENNGFGISVGGGIATIHRSIASGNANHGIAAVDNSVTVTLTSSVTAQNGSTGIFVVAGSTLAMESSLAHGNGDGLFVANGSTARISNSTFTNNTTGINNSGTVETRQNNTVRGNTTNVVGALTPLGAL
jgi:hypothetical protein